MTYYSKYQFQLSNITEVPKFSNYCENYILLVYISKSL